MKKRIISSLLLALVLFSCAGNMSPEMKKLETRKKILALNTKLNKLKIDLEKEKERNNKLTQEVGALNVKADVKTTSFSSSDAATTVKDAKETAKLLNKTQEANKDLSRSESKIQNIQKRIDKVQEKLDKLNKEIKFVNQGDNE